MRWRRGRAPETDPERVFKEVREVETQLRVSLGIFKEYLSELEAEIRQPQEEV